MTTTPQLRQRIDQLADDIGRLRRHVGPDVYAAHLGDRLAAHAEALYLIATPTAGELANQTAPGDTAATDEAIAVVDADLARLQARLGKTAA